MPTDRSSTMIRKQEIAGEIRHVYGIEIPSYLLQGFTVNGLNDMKGLLHDALQRATEQEQGRDFVHPLPGSPVRTGPAGPKPGLGHVTPPVSERLKTHLADTYPGLDAPLAPQLSARAALAGVTLHEGSETVTAAAATPSPTDTSRPRRPGQHVIFGVNTLQGTADCYCTIGRDHGPIGGPTHA